MWMNTDYAFKNGFELHYKNIKPKIIAEEYLENDGDDLYDYKVWCFNGNPEYSLFISNRKNHIKKIMSDKNWNYMSFYGSKNNDAHLPTKPKELTKLLELSKKLAEGFPHVRVDFYILNDGSFKFGEMTFTPASGIGRWNDEKYNKMLGDKIILPKQKYDYRKLFQSKSKRHRKPNARRRGVRNIRRF